MKSTRNPIKTRIFGRICASTPEAVWTIGDFLDFGTPDAIRKALQRLEEAGDLRRINHGLYDRPRVNQLTGKPSQPDYRSVIDAVARRDGARILIDGMTAANDLGLSDAVPGRVTVHSDTRIKPIHLGNLTITFRLTSDSKKLQWAYRPAMRIVQALHWLKPKLQNPEERTRLRRRIQSLLSDSTQGAAMRHDLEKGLVRLPAWMQDFLRDILAVERHSASTPFPRGTPKRPRRLPTA